MREEPCPIDTHAPLFDVLVSCTAGIEGPFARRHSRVAVAWTGRRCQRSPSAVRTHIVKEWAALDKTSVCGRRTRVGLPTPGARSSQRVLGNHIDIDLDKKTHLADLSSRWHLYENQSFDSRPGGGDSDGGSAPN
jgi:hypothetical protein